MVAGTFARVGGVASLHVLDVETGALRLRIDDHPGGVAAVLFGPGDRWFASAGEDGRIRL